MLEIFVRGTTYSHTFQSHFLEIQSPCFQISIAKQLLHLCSDLFSPYDPTFIWVQPQTHLPNIINEVIIHELVCKVWLAQEGTLLLAPSMVEFQPQWLKKQATERWLGTFCWRARLTIFSLEATLSWNPSGEALFVVLVALSGRTTHRNSLLESSSPSANSWNCVRFKTVMLPRAMYMTEQGGC